MMMMLTIGLGLIIKEATNERYTLKNITNERTSDEQNQTKEKKTNYHTPHTGIKING